MGFYPKLQKRFQFKLTEAKVDLKCYIKNTKTDILS